jgi:hypothetical protein
MAIYTGDIFADQYTVSSSVTNVQIAAASGSMKFGDSGDDTHQCTGSLFISGSSIALGDGNNNVVLGNNANFNIGGATNFTAVGYNAAGGNEGTAIKFVAPPILKFALFPRTTLLFPSPKAILLPLMNKEPVH